MLTHWRVFLYLQHDEKTLLDNGRTTRWKLRLYLAISTIKGDPPCWKSSSARTSNSLSHTDGCFFQGIENVGDQQKNKLHADTCSDWDSFCLDFLWKEFQFHTAPQIFHFLHNQKAWCPACWAWDHFGRAKAELTWDGSWLFPCQLSNHFPGRLSWIWVKQWGWRCTGVTGFREQFPQLGHKFHGTYLHPFP